MLLMTSLLAKVQSFQLSTQPKYALQGNVHRRTEIAILEGTKDLISLNGIANLSMIDIADHSQVSRATLYNHFRDKNAVLDALLASEITRLVEIADRSHAPAHVLESLSRAISTDTALAAMRIHDGNILTSMLSHTSSEHYITIAKIVFAATKTEAGTGIAMRWLIGQALQPLTAEQSRQQALALVDNTIF
jgi:AcrR family transcriptional regulator